MTTDTNSIRYNWKLYSIHRKAEHMINNGWFKIPSNIGSSLIEVWICKGSVDFSISSSSKKHNVYINTEKEFYNFIYFLFSEVGLQST